MDIYIAEMFGNVLVEHVHACQLKTINAEQTVSYYHPKRFCGSLCRIFQLCVLSIFWHAFWSKRGNIDTAAHFPWLHAMEKVKSDIKRMVILDLISTLIMIAMELRQRLTGYESTSPRHDGLEERQRPSGRNFGGHQGDDLEEGLTETPCKGMCQFCGKSCIRLKPGHSNHKCHKHLHWR